MTAPKKTHQIAPALARLAVATSDLHAHDENYRHGDVDSIAASLQRFGQVKPIVVQSSTKKIVAGNHTYAAAVKLGWTHIAAALVDLDDDEARAYLVADNRLSDIAENDDEALAAILADLEDAGKLEGTGFDADEVQALLDQVAKATAPPPDPTPAEAPDPGPGERDRTAGAGEMPQRQVVLVLTVEQADRFGSDIKRLATVYETQGIAATVLAITADAVRRADARPVTAQ